MQCILIEESIGISRSISNISKLSMQRRLFVSVNNILLIKEDAVCKHTVCAHFPGVDPPPPPTLLKILRIFNCAGSVALQLSAQLILHCIAK